MLNTGEKMAKFRILDGLTDTNTFLVFTPSKMHKVTKSTATKSYHSALSVSPTLTKGVNTDA